MIYLIQHGNTNYVKIGYSHSEKGVIKRLAACQTGNPIQLSLLGVIDGTQSGEKYIQSAFASKRIRNEWFDLTSKDIRRILDTKDVIKLARRIINKILMRSGDREIVNEDCVGSTKYINKTLYQLQSVQTSEEDNQDIIDKLSAYYPNKKEQTAAIEKIRFERILSKDKIGLQNSKFEM